MNTKWSTFFNPKTKYISWKRFGWTEKVLKNWIKRGSIWNQFQKKPDFFFIVIAWLGFEFFFQAYLIQKWRCVGGGSWWKKRLSKPIIKLFFVVVKCFILEKFVSLSCIPAKTIPGGLLLPKVLKLDIFYLNSCHGQIDIF